MRVRLKLKVEMQLWIARIIDDLNPEDFSILELINEFGAVGGTKHEDKNDFNGEQYIRNKVAALLSHGYIEKIAKGRYHVTQDGHKFRDSSEGDEK